MRVLCARLLPALALAGIVAVAGLVALGPGLSPVAASTPAPAVAPAAFASVATPQPQHGAGPAALAAPTPPMPAPEPPSPGKPSPPAVPSAKPVPEAPGTDPCGAINGIPASESCKGVGKNQAANDKCQSESFHDCNKPMTGKAQGAWQESQSAHTQAQQDFHAVPRDQSPAAGAAELCHSSSGMRERLTDADVIVPPSTWWSC
ncbi:hypothetical protein PUR57_10300 [Streptomyces sp. JV176]|uniref:hypothetical protein n=1 Tax=Streptomyces sp. JV176 TaxID=858630 RepID=UPI002E78F0A8|nr:hypothetical protein [Streptomyces sp. JV176]MEE1799058.1 hypothetical protein [Streptomyces sp. JV176]